MLAGLPGSNYAQVTSYISTCMLSWLIAVLWVRPREKLFQQLDVENIHIEVLDGAVSVAKV